MIKIGFTGTQTGLTEGQKRWITDVLSDLYKHGAEFHHGDCIGADTEAADIAFKIGYKLHSHPPIYNVRRAHHAFHVSYEPKDYLERNRDIVDEVEFLIGAPRYPNEKQRSGTWSTLRYARLTKTSFSIIPGDGHVLPGWPTQGEDYK